MTILGLIISRLNFFILKMGDLFLVLSFVFSSLKNILLRSCKDITEALLISSLCVVQENFMSRHHSVNVLN